MFGSLYPTVLLFSTFIYVTVDTGMWDGLDLLFAMAKAMYKFQLLVVFRSTIVFNLGVV